MGRPRRGIETGEELPEALRRELFEETGLRLTPAHAAQLVWVQTAALPEAHEHGYAGVTSFYVLVHVDAFEPDSGVAANAAGHPDTEGILDHRWWSLTDMTTAHGHGVLFSPRALPTLLSSLLTDGPATTPLTVGL
jgi:8-oxo-dGTP pyrophosphatase MutT (NUDIX family)